MIQHLLCLLGFHDWEYKPYETGELWEVRGCKACLVAQLKDHEFPGFKPRLWREVLK